MNERLLQELLMTAGLEMHDETLKKPHSQARRLWCPLPVVRDCLLASMQQPFLDVMKATRSDKRLVFLPFKGFFARFPVAAALRVALECAVQNPDKPNACPVCLSSSYSRSVEGLFDII